MPPGSFEALTGQPYVVWIGLLSWGFGFLLAVTCLFFWNLLGAGLNTTCNNLFPKWIKDQLFQIEQRTAVCSCAILLSPIISCWVLLLLAISSDTRQKRSRQHHLRQSTLLFIHGVVLAVHTLEQIGARNSIWSVSLATSLLVAPHGQCQFQLVYGDLCFDESCFQVCISFFS